MSALHTRALEEIARSAGHAADGAGATVRSALAAIRASRTGPDDLNAFLTLDDAGAAAVAEAVDRAVAGGSAAGPLAGVPVAIKDNICTRDMPTTCGSRILEGYVSPFEATAVRHLRAAGAVLVGKTNMDEFAMGSSTENSAYGPVRNPHDTTRVPGGSSGGSAAAVAAGLVPAALGSDTGGSVRQPAALCGVVGLKPTWGRVSRYGLVAFGSSLDQIGTFGKTVRDAALLCEVIAGNDPRDATCVDLPVPALTHASTMGVAGLTVGLPREYFGDGLDPDVRARCTAAIEALREQGVNCREVSLPHTAWAIPAYYVIAPAEASSNLARYDGVRYGLRDERAETARDVYTRSRSAGFGAEVKRRIMLGTFALSAGYHDQFYGRAQRVRARIRADFRSLFDAGVDAIFTPTTPAPAFRLGEKTLDPVQMYLSDVYTVTANLAGLPAVSVPIGTVRGLPVGGQVMADHWREDTVVRVAAALERALSP